MTAPRILGIRHHSPACARLVRAEIRARRPAIVLIEGPSDMNGRLGELALPHRLPVAIFSFRTGPLRRSSWFPACAHSPEWVALREAETSGARAAFMDLPAWADRADARANATADPPQVRGDAAAALAERLGLDGPDAAWETLFEQPLPPVDLRVRLDAYFEQLRADEPASAADAAREDFMARMIAWACSVEDPEKVLVVCGGWHAPELARLWQRIPPEPEMPRIDPPPAEGGEIVGSYLVPYSEKRLDSFAGYEAGMPSPGWQRALWEADEANPDAAGESVLGRVLERLRRRGLVASTADACAALTLARGLRALRGHAALARVDVLDGLAGALVKEALDAPLPWTMRGRLEAGTAPVLVEIVAEVAGDAEGRLAPGTLRPPLLDDAREQLRAAGVEPGPRPQAVAASLLEPEGRRRSRVLHRMLAVGAPGFLLGAPARRERGPQGFVERWSVRWMLETEAALIEASSWGATLEDAASARLESMARDGSLDDVARLLALAVHAGVEGLAGRLLGEIQRAASDEPELGRVGAALSALVELDGSPAWESRPRQALESAAEAVAARTTWLFEAQAGASVPADPNELNALVALRDAIRLELASPVQAGALRAAASRRAHDAGAPPALSGAAVGLLFAGGLGAPPEDVASVARALNAAALPSHFGELLCGLLALAREEVLREAALVRILDEVVQGFPAEDFLVALPAMRLAFTWLPPGERGSLASRLAEMHGASPAAAHALLRSEVPPEAVAAGMALELEVTAIRRRHGLAT